MLQYLKIMFDGRFNKDDERGASAVEYGLLIAGIAVAIIAAVFLLGTHLSGMFSNVDTKINGTTTTP